MEEKDGAVLCLLKEEEREKAWDLWREIFPEDSDAFLAAYAKTHADNRIYGMVEEGKLLAMAQFNPYAVHNGTAETVTVPYIVGVATRPSCRGKGYMKKLLKKGLLAAREEGAPFAFLMPAAEEIYTPAGFVTVCHQHMYYGRNELTELMNEAMETGSALLPETENHILCPLSSENLLPVSKWAERYMRGAYSISCERSPLYFTRLQTEMESEGGSVFAVLTEEGEVDGYLTAWPGETCEIREAIIGTALKRPFRKFLKIRTKTPAIMFRLLDPVCFLAPVHRWVDDGLGERPYRVLFYLEDAFLPENTGWYQWDIHLDRSVVQKISTGTGMENAIPGGYPVEKVDKLWKTTADGLVRWRFGDEEGPQLRGMWKSYNVFLNENV